LPLERICEFSLSKTSWSIADSPIKEVINHLHEVRVFGASRRKWFEKQ